MFVGINHQYKLREAEVDKGSFFKVQYMQQHDAADSRCVSISLLKQLLTIAQY